MTLFSVFLLLFEEEFDVELFLRIFSFKPFILRCLCELLPVKTLPGLTIDVTTLFGILLTVSFVTELYTIEKEKSIFCFVTRDA